MLARASRAARPYLVRQHRQATPISIPMPRNGTAVRPLTRYACTDRSIAYAEPTGRAAPLAAQTAFLIGKPTIGRALFSTSTSGEQRMEFQAETRKLLDIVTNSIYTDKEVFLRELISNASDALEKFRYQQSTGGVAGNSASSLEISIDTDEKNNTLTISDNGIGMSRDDLIANLGTIARSGSKRFVEELQKKADGSRDGDGIIGQFGVGFYSSFMVAKEVVVESTPAALQSSEGDLASYRWRSDGSGEFGVERIEEGGPAGSGSRIVLYLKDGFTEYADAEKIKGIIKKYSNFVSFPIKVNGEIVNTVSAIWTQDKKTVTDQQYEDFYKFIANAFDKPRYRLHFQADAPIDLKCLFFVPTFHAEKFGMGRTEPGVNLYSRKVLIESKPKDLLPEWLRFVKGVVDSEDLPLSIAREKPQDSRLLARIKDVVTRRLLRFFSEEAKNNPEAYKEFYIEYHMFLKEGVCQDYKFMEQLSKLLRFESSLQGEGALVSFDDYLARCPPEQKNIYYLVAPSRNAALASPYFETFRKHGKEVLLLYNTIDDFVMSNLKTFNGRNLVSAETSSVNLSEEGGAVDSAENKEESDDKKDESVEAVQMLSTTEADELCGWLKITLGDKRVREVRTTTRLSDSPAIITDHESGAMRRMLKMVEQANAGKSLHSDLPPQVLEVNPEHPLIIALHSIRSSNSDEQKARLVAEQLMDNALIAAGLVEDPRYMLPRLNEILLSSLKK